MTVAHNFRDEGVWEFDYEDRLWPVCMDCGQRQDDPAHVGAPRRECPICGHSTAPIWFGQPGSGEHSEDDGSCITCGPELGKRCAQ